MRLSETILFKDIKNIDDYNVHIKHYECGELIYPRDITENGIVLNGCMKVYKNDLSGGISILEHIEPGDIVIESQTSFAAQFVNVTYICAKKTEVAYFDKHKVLQTPQLAERLISMIEARVFRMKDRMAVLCGRSIRDKLKCYFEILAAKKGQKCFTFSITMGELANLLSVDRSAMSREIKKMKEENILKIEKHTVTILWETDF